MGIRKGRKHEFSFVKGFGDSIRPACDYGFPRDEYQRIRAKHPGVEVVWDVDRAMMAVYAVKDTTVKAKDGWHPFTIVQKLFNVASAAEVYQACDQLDYLRWRNHTDREGVRFEQEIIADREQGEQEARDSVINDSVVDEAADFLWDMLGKKGARVTAPALPRG